MRHSSLLGATNEFGNSQSIDVENETNGKLDTTECIRKRSSRRHSEQSIPGEPCCIARHGRCRAVDQGATLSGSNGDARSSETSCRKAGHDPGAGCCIGSLVLVQFSTRPGTRSNWAWSRV